MKLKKYNIFFSIVVLYADVMYADVQPITPGEPLYGIVSRIGVELDEVSSGVSAIEDQLQGLSGSSLESISSLLETITDQIDSGFSITENLLLNLSAADVILQDMGSTIDSTVNQTQSLVQLLDSDIDMLTILVNNMSARDALIYSTVAEIDTNIDNLAIAVNNLSIQDALTYDVVTQIDANVDSLAIAVNNVSARDALIYNTVTEIDTKIDNLAIAVNNLSMQDALTYDVVTQIDANVDNLAIAVNNISARDALIYNTVTGIDSKIDLLITDNSLVNSIYDTVTEIDTKVDTLNVKADILSAQDVLIYNLSSVIDSKVDEIRSFPDFSQTPTTFQSARIDAKTSRYFFQVFTPAVSATEAFAGALRNTGANNRIVRISAVGFFSATALLTTLRVAVYKDATITAGAFVPVDAANSDIEFNSTATYTLATGTQLFEDYAVLPGTSAGGVVNTIKYMPKELYSITIAPGETVTFTLLANAGGTARLPIMWEEIINY